jgi:hypothetical protein
VNCGPRSNFLYIAITVYYFTCLFTFPHTITFYHSIRSILCLQQTGEIDNLIVSWGKVLGCVVCSFYVAAGAKQSPGRGVMSTHASVLVDNVGPPSAEVCRIVASFP